MAHLGLDTGAVRLPLVAAGAVQKQTIAGLVSDAGLQASQLAAPPV